MYRNLGPDAFAESDRARLNGAYRATWFRNQIGFDRAAAALRALHEAGIRTMLLKGAALTLAHYRDPGVRPMDDIDVLVPPDDHAHACAVLERAGWTILPETAVGFDPHATTLSNRDGWRLDLHRFALAQPVADDAFWAASLEIELPGVPTRTPCAADEFFHVVLHGARWSVIPPVRWIADAVMVERTSETGIDWERVTAEAIRRRKTVTLEAALEYLADAVALEAPLWARERLRTAPKAPLERWAHRAWTGPFGGGSWAPVVLDQYLAASRLDPTFRPTPFLLRCFRARTRRELAGRLARKSVQVGVTQTALRVAPRLVAQCPSCGRRTVTLHVEQATLCGTCAATAAPAETSG